MQEVCKKALLRFIVEVRNCRTDFPIQFLMNSLIVAVDDVRHTVSDGTVF